MSSGLELEKPELTIGFIPILCSAPLIYAHSHGFFERNGLRVTLRRAPGWSGIKELIVYGHLDAVHMLSPMPLACGLGIDGKPADVRLVAVQNVNGQALTLARRHAEIGDVRDMRGFVFGVPYRFSMHYYLLCHFLAQHGVHPLKDVNIVEVAPPCMPYYLEKGWVDGVFAPEPFNQIPVHRGTGFIYLLSKELWPGHPCCSMAVAQEFIDAYPRTYRAMLRSVLEAEWALHRAAAEDRKTIAREICSPAHLKQPDSVPVEQALTGRFPVGRGGMRDVPDRIDFIPFPWQEYGTWMLCQMQRWAQLPGRVDYREVVESAFENDVWEIAEAIGFSRRQRPAAEGVFPPADQDPFDHMRQQPSCAYQPEPEPLVDYGLTEAASHRLRALVCQMAEVVGGELDRAIELTGADEIGLLEQVLGEAILNLRFAHLGRGPRHWSSRSPNAGGPSGGWSV